MAAAEGLTITREIGDKVDGVDHKIGLINDGELYRLKPSPNISSAFYSVWCKGERNSGSTSGQSTQRSKAFVIFLTSSPLIAKA